MHPFSTPLKISENLKVSDVFKGWKKGALGTNRLKYLTLISSSLYGIHPALYFS